ncbi:unnamed protein product [Prorocentrum cordatum]|uniref:Uncharacterized protein n=1 Tax=Prorocentrum cordatum TaxID=2364126 RepID=A0ABN9Y296_9DINO|nr:unnamed protein product [Polarella glacialis]
MLAPGSLPTQSVHGAFLAKACGSNPQPTAASGTAVRFSSHGRVPASAATGRLLHSPSRERVPLAAHRVQGPCTASLAAGWARQGELRAATSTSPARRSPSPCANKLRTSYAAAGLIVQGVTSHTQVVSQPGAQPRRLTSPLRAGPLPPFPPAAFAALPSLRRALAACAGAPASATVWRAVRESFQVVERSRSERSSQWGSEEVRRFALSILAAQGVEPLAPLVCWSDAGWGALVSERTTGGCQLGLDAAERLALCVLQRLISELESQATSATAAAPRAALQRSTSPGGLAAWARMSRASAPPVVCHRAPGVAQGTAQGVAVGAGGPGLLAPQWREASPAPSRRPERAEDKGHCQPCATAVEVPEGNFSRVSAASDMTTPRMKESDVASTLACSSQPLQSGGACSALCSDGLQRAEPARYVLTGLSDCVLPGEWHGEVPGGAGVSLSSSAWPLKASVEDAAGLAATAVSTVPVARAPEMGIAAPAGRNADEEHIGEELARLRQALELERAERRQMATQLDALLQRSGLPAVAAGSAPTQPQDQARAPLPLGGCYRTAQDRVSEILAEGRGRDPSLPGGTQGPPRGARDCTGGARSGEEAADCSALECSATTLDFSQIPAGLQPAPPLAADETPAYFNLAAADSQRDAASPLLDSPVASEVPKAPLAPPPAARGLELAGAPVAATAPAATSDVHDARLTDARAILAELERDLAASDLADASAAASLDTSPLDGVNIQAAGHTADGISQLSFYKRRCLELASEVQHRDTEVARLRAALGEAAQESGRGCRSSA